MWTDGNDNFRSASDGIEEICKEWKLPILADSSGRGWSKFSTLQRCPYLYELLHIRKEKPSSTSMALDVGSIYHALHAVDVLALLRLKPTSMSVELKDKLLVKGVNPQAIYEAWRLYEAYRAKYEDDYLIPLAVEESAKDPRTGFTCRYDLIARIDDPPHGYLKGTYVVERKTSAKFDMATLDAWDLDGEVLGQIAIYERAKLARRFGKLKGLIVDIVGKQQTPQFHRTFVAISSVQTRRHLKDLVIWSGLEQRFKRTGYFPRSLAGCVNRYGTCSFFDRCRIES